MERREMADQPVIYAGANSPQAVALELMREIAYAEGKELTKATGATKPDREWILTAYFQCYKVAMGHPYPPANR
jgi:hypothetical protein